LTRIPLWGIFSRLDMSNLLLKRTQFNELCTQGELYLEGAFECYTLEPAKSDDPIVKPRCIPVGTYKFTLAFSEKHGRIVPLLLDVPDFTEIEIHIGNFPGDTLGCILIGRMIGPNAVYESSEAFKLLFPRLSPGTIQIIEEPA
jgi:hypothetical protein